MHTEPPIKEPGEPGKPGPLGAVAVFPLPNVVLFPGVMLPLHIFEPRYQHMLQDVMAGSRHFVLARADAANSTGMADVGCLAQVMRVERDANGRSNILVRGEARVRLVTEQPATRGYRLFCAQALPAASMLNEPERSRVFGCLQQFLVQLSRAANGRDAPLAEVLRASSDPTVATDFLAASLVRDPVRQQAVLAAPRLAARIEAMADSLAEALLRLKADDLARSPQN